MGIVLIFWEDWLRGSLHSRVGERRGGKIGIWEGGGEKATGWGE